MLNQQDKDADNDKRHPDADDRRHATPPGTNQVDQGMSQQMFQLLNHLPDVTLDTRGRPV
jgi:hypothetical protein